MGMDIKTLPPEVPTLEQPGSYVFAPSHCGQLNDGSEQCEWSTEIIPDRLWWRTSCYHSPHDDAYSCRNGMLHGAGDGTPPMLTYGNLHSACILDKRRDEQRDSVLFKCARPAAIPVSQQVDRGLPLAFQ